MGNAGWNTYEDQFAEIQRQDRASEKRRRVRRQKIRVCVNGHDRCDGMDRNACPYCETRTIITT